MTTVLALIFMAAMGSGLTVWVLWDRIGTYTDRGVKVGGVEYVSPFDMAVVCDGERENCAAFQAWTDLKEQP